MFSVQRKQNRSNGLSSDGRHIPETDRGQVILEFTFCMIIVLLMIYGISKVMTWTGRDYAGRNKAHDATLTSLINPSYIDINTGPLRQIDSYFYTPVSMNAIWTGN